MTTNHQLICQLGKALIYAYDETGMIFRSVEDALYAYQDYLKQHAAQSDDEHGGINK